MSKYVSHSTITGVRFSIAGENEVRSASCVEVRSHDAFSGGRPAERGVYDLHMGSIDVEAKCETCFKPRKKCPGHEGHIELNTPIWNPNAIAVGKRWLKVICHHCGKIVFPEAVYKKFPDDIRLTETARVAPPKTCPHCSRDHPIVRKGNVAKGEDDMALVAEVVSKDTGGQNKALTTLFPVTIEKIFARVLPETVHMLGLPAQAHPSRCVTRAVPVIAVRDRPDVKKAGASRSQNDDLTTLYQALIKKNNSLPPITESELMTEDHDDKKKQKLKKPIFELNRAYMDIVKTGAESGAQSLSVRIKGKQGRIRKNLLGKRVHDMCRSVIYGDPRRKIGEIGLPLMFARTVQVEEVVQEYNRRRLLTYIQNGSTVYPGASRIKKRDTGAEYAAELYQDRELENGDIVYRDIIDGDIVYFNRQPSLIISNITAMTVKVIMDITNLAISMNVIACAYFNADFDGDAMNIIILPSISSRVEIAELGSAANWFISHTTASPALGQTEDSVIGAAELTRNGTEYDRYHALMIFQHCTRLPKFAPGNHYTGRELMSRLLDDTPINFSRATEWYKEDYAHRINYDPSDIRVNITAGRMTSGVLDKTSIGKGSNGGIYHIIANEYGSATALRVMFDMQQIAISHLLFHGFTAGIKDLVIPRESRDELECIANDMINKSKLITEELNAGEIVPPIGKTVEQYYEELQMAELTIVGDFIDPILAAVDHENNNLMKMVAVGSKGKVEYFMNMISAIGQKQINGERIRQKFGFKRTLPYFRRFDPAPEARGYIANSYMNGLNSAEFIMNAMASRFDLISKALSTSITGDQNRKSIKNLESIIINNLRAAMKHLNVIQLAYGEDFIDPRKLVSVPFATVMISMADFTAQFSHPGYPEFAASMTFDREKFRRVYLQIERNNTNEIMSNSRKVSVDVGRIIIDVMTEYVITALSQTPSTSFDLSAGVATVETTIGAIPYVLSNDIQRGKKGVLPEHYYSATWLLTMLVRIHLGPRKLEALATQGLTNAMLQLICDKILLKYSESLISPGNAVGIISAQSFSEPLTQYMLDAHTRSSLGGTSKDSMTQTREILGAKDTDKLVGPVMMIPLRDQWAGSESTAQEIANRIEMTVLRQFANRTQIFYEAYGHPRHPKYAHEKQLIAEFIANNPLLVAPSDLVKWCVRFTLRRSEMILKGMPLETIISRLREVHPNIWIVNTAENAPEIIFRIYFRGKMFRGVVTLDSLKAAKDELFSTVIRGVEGIRNARPLKISRNIVGEDGAILRKDRWAVTTIGTNLAEVIALPWVDAMSVTTQAVKETAAVFGIEAARQRLIYAIKSIVDKCEHRHYLIYADEMTYTGRVTSVEATGLKSREASNVLLRVGFSNPMKVLEEAATACAYDQVTGVTAPLLVGGIPRVGTTYNQIFINEDFIRDNVKLADDVISELFD